MRNILKRLLTPFGILFSFIGLMGLYLLLNWIGLETLAVAIPVVSIVAFVIALGVDVIIRK